MRIMTSYAVKIKNYNHIFQETVTIYRNAVDFFIKVALTEWGVLKDINNQKERVNLMESYTVISKKRPVVAYDFGTSFYKFPCYLRRAAISGALGKVSSYKSNLANWEQKDPTARGKKPSLTGAGYTYPAMYRDNMFVRTGTYTAELKVYVRNTWDWISVDLKKSDVDYILHHCKCRTECVPTLQKRGKEWFLDFSFEENIKLPETKVTEQTIVSVDLGINCAATVSVMRSDGTILGRHFCKLPKETDSLNHAINRIKKAQQHGNLKTPRLWAKAKGINDDIAVKTARFIIETAVLYNADVIVFEHLDCSGKKRGSKKQLLHMWRSRYVQTMVTDKAHRLKIRISRVNSWGTSSLAYDGSGKAERGIDGNYSICRFPNGKIYNCDLSASYNIGARYFIREIIKSLPETARLHLEAEVPQICKRSTCTFSTLISLNAALLSA